MTPSSDRTRVLDPLERFSEIVFGLIMVLTGLAMVIIGITRVALAIALGG